MKKQIISILLSILVLSGCSAKGTDDSVLSTNGKAKNEITAGQASPEFDNGGKRESVDTNFNSLKPKSVPELSSKQKSQIDSKLNSTLKDIDTALKSLEDVSEIDLSSLQ